MQKYRDKLVNALKLACESLAENAEELVDRMDLHTGMIVTINLNDCNMPTISIEQSHIMHFPNRKSMFFSAQNEAE